MSNEQMQNLTWNSFRDDFDDFAMVLVSVPTTGIS